jgi:hypothetical protein
MIKLNKHCTRVNVIGLPLETLSTPVLVIVANYKLHIRRKLIKFVNLKISPNPR